MLTLAPKDLALLAQYMGAPTVINLPDPFASTLAEELPTVLQAIHAKLVAQGWVTPRADGRFLLARSISEGLYPRLFPLQILRLTDDETGEQVSFYQAETGWIQETAAPAGSLTLAATSDVAEGYLTLLTEASQAAPSTSLPQSALPLLLDQASTGQAGAQAFLLDAGWPQSAAERLAGVLASNPKRQTLLHLAVLEGEWQVNGCTILTDGSACWTARPFSRDGAPWITLHRRV